jgi:phosphate/sulfate permease
VSNDAVNFLNSALGSRAASFRLIMLIAAAGILLGAISSSGMMEVARKGLFHPDKFMFNEVMLIFFAVMVTNILLLDFFNTFGMPTSTTVSLVFGILGSAVSMSVIKIISTDSAFSTIGNYINSDKVLAIITGILLSVVLAFAIGAIIQWITRILFTFRYEKKLKYLGGIFGGLSLVAILYFLLIKGLKDSALVSSEQFGFIEAHTGWILLISFISFSLILQLLQVLFRINILKVIVLAGTFALAMAFAGNDLVNFIGVPLAGYKSYQIFMSHSPAVSPDALKMDALLNPVETDYYILIATGLIMILTLWFSKKARTVIETSLQLSRQDESGKEQFGSSYLARVIVQGFNSLNKYFSNLSSARIGRFINSRYENDRPKEKASKHDKAIQEDKPVFDLIRASVNTLVASALIAAGTSLKLPLSTTYVTFMVAMGTSLSDRAWGRDSAVYRITGVLAVIAGWFFTAFISFVLAGIVLFILYIGDVYSIIGISALVVLLIIRSNRLHAIREKSKKTEQQQTKEAEMLTPDQVISRISIITSDILTETESIYSKTFAALFSEDRKKLKKLQKEVILLNKKTKRIKENAYHTASSLSEDFIPVGDLNIQVFESLREVTYCLNYITIPAFIHVNNVHKPMPEEQQNEMKAVIDRMKSLFINLKMNIIEQKNDCHATEKESELLIDMIEKFRIEQVKRMRKDTANNRTNMLYLGFLHETNNMISHLQSMVIVCERFREIKPSEK